MSTYLIVFISEKAVSSISMTIRGTNDDECVSIGDEENEDAVGSEFHLRSRPGPPPPSVSRHLYKVLSSPHGESFFE